MRYNVHYEIASLLFLALIYIYYLTQYKKHNVLNRRYQWLILYSFLMILTDIITAFTNSYYTHIPTVLNLILNFATFIFFIACGHYFCKYIATLVEGDLVKERPLNNIILVVFIILEILNIKFGFFYYFDPVGGYMHGKYYYVQQIFAYYYIVYSALILVYHHKTIDKRVMFGTGSYVFLVAFFSLLQILVCPNVLLTGLGIALALLMIFLSLETPDYFKLQITMEELEKSRSEANEANKAKSRFLANMSHEIRTPLNSILGMNEMILRESKDENTLGYAKTIKMSSNILLSLINDILDFSKIESGMMEIFPVDYDLSSTISDLAIMVEQRAKDKGLELIIDVDPNINKELHGDEVRIKQVVTNLLTNAIKYTDNGVVTFKVTGKSCDKANMLLIFSVTDTGIGIKKENLSKLFEEFERVDLTHNRSIEGTGLGLAISSRLAVQMDGHITVESEYGKGSTFSFSVPQRKNSDIKIGHFKTHTNTVEVKEYHEAFTAPHAMVLAVDDNATNLDVLGQLLKKTEVQLSLANSGARALKMMSKIDYHIVLLDHMMPEMDGIETLKKAKEQDQTTGHNPVYIVLTANAVVGAKESYLKEGFSDYICKPIDADELESTLLKYLPENLVHKNV